MVSAELEAEFYKNFGEAAREGDTFSANYLVYRYREVVREKKIPHPLIMLHISDCLARLQDGRGNPFYLEGRTDSRTEELAVMAEEKLLDGDLPKKDAYTAVQDDWEREHGESISWDSVKQAHFRYSKEHDDLKEKAEIQRLIIGTKAV